jgi:hypothetical protein
MIQPETIDRLPSKIPSFYEVMIPMPVSHMRRCHPLQESP